MKLYDIFYHGNSMDSAMPFPKKPDPDIRLIVNVNQEGDAWTVRRELDHDILVRLVKESRSIEIRPTEYYETEFREALGGKVAGFAAVSSDGEKVWVPDGYPCEDDRRKLTVAWHRAGRPCLTSLQFVEITNEKGKEK